MVTLIKNTNQKTHVFFMTHVFSQSEHPFGQCGHFSQVEPFEKPWFLVMKKMCWWVALKLFFVYNESITTYSPWQMVKQHTTTLRSKTCLEGKLINVIWGDDWNVEYFVDNSTKISFGKLIHDMYDPNLEARRIVQHIVHTLMGPLYNWTALKECYWRQP